MMEANKKRKVRNGAIVGLISGLIISAVCYFAVGNNPAYFMFTAFGLAIGAGQAYVSPDE